MKKEVSSQEQDPSCFLIAFEDFSGIPPLRWLPEEEEHSVGVHLQSLPEIQSNGPVLRVTNSNGEIEPFSVFDVAAVMLYPHDSVKRQKALAPIAAYIDGEMLRSVAREANAFYLTALIDRYGGFPLPTAINGSPDLLTLWNKNLSIGMAIGHLLYRACQFGCLGLGASINRAIFLETQLREKRGGKGFTSLGPRRLRSEWARYKPVAHFWLAYLLHFAELYVAHKGDLIGRSNFIPADSERYMQFLSRSELFRRLGTQQISHGQRAPTLSSDEAWQTEPVLPFANAFYSFPPLDDLETDILKGYRSEERFSKH